MRLAILLPLAVSLCATLTGSANASPFHRLDDATCADGLAAFQKTVYAKVNRDCAECHAPGGRGPSFDQPDPAAAYTRIKSYVNFSDTDRSVLAVRAGNGHCGKENCNDASGADMKKQLAAWWDMGEKNCPQFGKYFSAAMAAPADLPTDHTQWQTLTWDLGSISDDFDGVKFSIEAQRYTIATPDASGAYRFRKPRIQFGFEPIHVKGLRILINGGYNPQANAYVALDQVTAPQESDGGGVLAYPILSDQTTILLQEKATDMFSLAFDDISIVSLPMCKALSRFKEVVSPQLTAAACTSCHTKGGNAADPNAVKDFSMDLKTDDQLCSAFLQRSYLDRPLRSPIVDIPARGKLEHPAVFKDPTAYLQAVSSWLTMEAPTTTPSESAGIP